MMERLHTIESLADAYVEEWGKETVSEAWLETASEDEGSSTMRALYERKLAAAIRARQAALVAEFVYLDECHDLDSRREVNGSEQREAVRHEMRQHGLDELPIFSGDGDNVEDTGEVLYAGAIT